MSIPLREQVADETLIREAIVALKVSLKLLAGLPAEVRQSIVTQIATLNSDAQQINNTKQLEK